MVSARCAHGEARRLGQPSGTTRCKPAIRVLQSGETITVRVRRSRKTANSPEFRVPYRKWMRVLDALNWIAENDAPDLAYRWFCGSKMCGTCAVRMNGREVLACWEAVEPDMTIEPLRNLPVIRDLVMDRTPFDRKVEALEPWIERAAPYAGFPEPLNHKDMKNASKALDCIGCMCCYSACPVIGLGDLTDFAGPAPLVQLGQTALDPRNDPAKVARSLSLTGIFNCVSCYKCEEVCPASIPIVTQVIEPLKAKAAALVPGMAKHSRALRATIAVRGYVDPTRWCCAFAGSPRSSICRARCGSSCAERSIPSRPFSGKERRPAPPPRAYWAASAARRPPMRFAYYPGCSARSTCAELNEATHKVAAGWGSISCRSNSATCTGARELRAIDPVNFYTLNVRILALAEREGLPLMTICNTCTLNVLDAHAAFVGRSGTSRSDQRAGLPTRACTTAAEPASAISSGCYTRISERNGCARSCGGR